MNQITKTYISLIICTLGVIAIGGIINSFTKLEISTRYNTLNSSTLTSPNHIFLIAWTGIIGACSCGHLGRICISQAKYYQNLIRNSACNWTFPRSFDRYGYSSRHDNVAFLPKDKIGIVTYAYIFALDSVRKLLKLLHMAI